MEKAGTRQLSVIPKHPRRADGLHPDIDQEVDRLQTLEGLVPSLYDMPSGCQFGEMQSYPRKNAGKNHSQCEPAFRPAGSPDAGDMNMVKS